MFALICDYLGLAFVFVLVVVLKGLKEVGELAADVADDLLLGLSTLNLHHFSLNYCLFIII